jgi:integrase
MGAVSRTAAATAMHVDEVQVSTATGVHTVSSASSLHIEPLSLPSTVGHPERLAPLMRVVQALMVSIPETSARKVRAACKLWKNILDWWAVPAALVTGHLVCAFVVIRCAPPVNFEVPSAIEKPVLPSTAAGDIDCLRRASRLGVEDMAQFRAALHEESVSMLMRAIGARVKRLRTNKRALLFVEVERFWETCKTAGTAIAIRDGFALVLAFSFATRVSELLALYGRDLTIVPMRDGSFAIKVAFNKVKTRRTIFNSHQPFEVTCGGPLLCEAFELFNKTVSFRDDIPIFHHLRASSEKSLSRDWFSTVVKAAAPNATTHSCRVGAATELWAAGVSLADIMAIGRWTSTAALLYIIGNLDDTVRASRKMGTAGLSYSSEGIRRQLGTTVALPDTALPVAGTNVWLAALQSDSVDDSE